MAPRSVPGLAAMTHRPQKDTWKPFSGKKENHGVISGQGRASSEEVAQVNLGGDRDQSVPWTLGVGVGRGAVPQAPKDYTVTSQPTTTCKLNPPPP